MSSEPKKPPLYIGSSTAGLNYARAVRHALREITTPVLWNDPNAFPLSRTTIASLEHAVHERRFRFAVLVCTPDDEVHARSGRKDEGIVRVPRDNVLMEIGFFMGQLGVDHTFVIRHPDASMPANLYGMTTADIEVQEDGDCDSEVAAACYKIRQMIQKLESIPPKPKSGPSTLPGFGTDVMGYANVGQSEFNQQVVDWIRESQEITFVGTGLNVLFQSEVRRAIVDRARAGELKATICFGNPFSPHVAARLIEEERGKFMPEVATEGIIKRVRAMLDDIGQVPNVEVKLFNNYPTMSVFRFDSNRFIYYPMGYRRLGNLCPTTTVYKPGALCDFLDEMIDNYLEDAVDAREVLRVRVNRAKSKQFVRPERIRQVAVYAIPDRESEFYQIGAELLGYDVFSRQQSSSTGEFQRYVGNAQQYGFHLTILDVMYVDVAQIPSMLCELKALGATIPQFELRIDKLSEGRYWRNSLELCCSDPSGNLERLLAETTLRIRPQGLGTNYTLDPDTLRRLRPLNESERTMLDAYQSPFVFSAFQPHFTLASPREIEPSVLKRMYETAANRFRDYLGGGYPVPIDKVYFLQKPLESESWDEIRDHNIIGLR